MHFSENIAGQDIPIVLGIVVVAAIVMFVIAVRRGRISLSDPSVLPAAILVLALAVALLAVAIAMRPTTSCVAGSQFQYSSDSSGGGTDGPPVVITDCP